MKIEVRTKNLRLSDRLEDYVDKKVERLERYLSNITDAYLDLAKEGQSEQPIAQLTIRNSRGVVLRVEDKKQEDIFAAVDVVVDKMYRQIKRYKTKKRRKGADRWIDVAPDMPAELLEEVFVEEPHEEEGQIIRRKEILLTPMNEEEAVEQLELLGHDFFVYLDGETGNTNVLYKREDGNYGLLLTAVS
jgi:putative sigma-54 modulation protein